MPVTINELLIRLNIKAKTKVVKWGDNIPCFEKGVYFVSLSSDPSKSSILNNCPILVDILKDWINIRNGFDLDGNRINDISKIKERIESFWFKDENIIYIGKATCLNKRIKQYYNTPYGKRKPHAGGHWIKMLSNLNDLFIHYLPFENYDELELLLLDQFGKQISSKSYKQLLGTDVITPFANLEKKKGERKKHDLGNMREKCKRIG